MQRKLSLFVIGMLSLALVQAQSGTGGRKPIEYKTFMTLPVGDEVVPLYSCLWMNASNQFYNLVIRHSDKTFSAITEGTRKDNIPQQQMNSFISGIKCDDHDPYKARKSTLYTGSKLKRYNSKGKAIIVAGKKTYGPYEKVNFIQESGERFIAVVTALNNGKMVDMYVDSDGKQKILPGVPQQLITNNDLTKAAVVMDPAGAEKMEIINALPREKQIEYSDQINKKDNQVWFSNDSLGTLAKKYSQVGYDALRRAEYDVTGKHFLAVYGSCFLMDGKPVNKNISGANTRVFAGQNPANFAYYSDIYLNFSDGTNIFNAYSPFLTVENGREYLNWFVLETGKNGNPSVIKQGKREL